MSIEKNVRQECFSCHLVESTHKIHKTKRDNIREQYNCPMDHAAMTNYTDRDEEVDAVNTDGSKYMDTGGP